jgi:hypothetical protein
MIVNVRDNGLVRSGGCEEGLLLKHVLRKTVGIL